MDWNRIIKRIIIILILAFGVFCVVSGIIGFILTWDKTLALIENEMGILGPAPILIIFGFPLGFGAFLILIILSEDWW